MNIFRLFFVSTVLIPVLVVVATSDEGGLRVRKPRSIVISEDGSRTGRRHNPVNITDKNCPSLGCSGNLTTNSYNGKGSLASTLLPRKSDVEHDPGSSERRFDSSSTESSPVFHHSHPLKLEIKSIKNSTRSDIANSQDYVVAEDINEVGVGRAFFTAAVLVSWAFFWTWRVILSAILFHGFGWCWNLFRKKYGIGDDYIETYVKLGKDSKHPFHHYGEGWNPTFGISLKTKDIPYHHGWNGWGGWPSHAWEGWNGWPSPENGWGGWNGWPSSYPHHHDHHDHHPGHGWGKKKGWKSESEEFEDEIRHHFDKEKGFKIAQKYAKKYGKKAHKHGLRPSKYSYMFDKDGNIILGGKSIGYSWRRRSESVDRKGEYDNKNNQNDTSTSTTTVKTPDTVMNSLATLLSNTSSLFEG